MSVIKAIFEQLINPSANLDSIFSQSDGSVEKRTGNGEPPAGARLHIHNIFLNLPLMVGVTIVLGLLAVVLFGPLWASYDPYITARSLVPHFDVDLGTFIEGPFGPSLRYPLGTDKWGNDILALLMYGARITLVVGAYITLARVVIGTMLGAIAGWNPDSALDQLIMGTISTIGSVPMLISSMILIYALGIERGVVVFIIALSIIGWTEIAQQVRSELLRIRKMLYIEAAESVGLTQLQLVVRHALPNVLPRLLIISFLEMGAVLLLMAELGFLGVFIGGTSTYIADPLSPAPAEQLLEMPEWGAIVSKGVPYLRSYPHLVLGPALAFLIAIMGLNALGEGLRRLLESTTVSTGILLKKRMILIIGVFAVVTTVIIDYTGPKASYAHVADTFDAGQAYNYASALAETEGITSTDYIADMFQQYEVDRGWKEGYSGYYFYPPKKDLEAGATPSVLGFIGGYDVKRAHELVVVAVPSDAAGSVGTILEITRVWQQEHLDPRRSVLFVAWAGDWADLEPWLANPDNFKKLSPKVPTQPLKPAMVFQVGTIGDSATLQVDPASDEKLRDIFAASAGSMDVSIRPEIVETPDTPVMPDAVPSLYVTCADTESSYLPEDFARINEESLGAAGQTLALTLTKIVREPRF